MSAHLAKLRQAVHKQASASAWSEGVALARRDGVTALSEEDAEIRLQVLLGNGNSSASVQLYPEDLDWSCDCKAKIDPCSHVAAAVIALGRAEELGLGLPRSRRAAGSLRYKLYRDERFLSLERELVIEGAEPELIKGPLNQYKQLSATSTDLIIEAALGGERRGKLSSSTWHSILPLLMRLDSALELDGTAVRCQRQAMGLVIRVYDEGSLVVVRALRHPDIDESFVNGVVRCGNTLHPAAEIPLQAAEAQSLQRGLKVARRDWPGLVSETLPRLSESFPLEIDTAALPPLVEALPRLIFDASEGSQGLGITAQIVYGDPIVATLNGTELITTAWGAVRRARPREGELRERLRRELHWEVGRLQLVPPSARSTIGKRLEAMGASLSGEAAHHFASLAPLRVEARLNEGGELNLEFHSTSTDAGSGAKASTAAVLHAWQGGLSFVSLDGGGYAPLPHDWLKRYGPRLLLLAEAKAAAPDRPIPALRPLEAELALDLGLQPRQDWLELGQKLQSARRSALGESEATAVLSMPTDLQLPLRPYQALGAQWLMTLGDLGCGALLADDMGLGKTAQTIAALQGRVLVIAPTSVVSNWGAELQRFRPGLTVNLYHGPNRQLEPAAAVTVSSYALLRRDSTLLSAESWDCVVLDEAQNIKNPDAQVSRAAAALQAKRRIALSGTPIENSLTELWSLFRFLEPGFLGSRTSFENTYGRGTQASEAQLTALRHAIAPQMLRRLKAEVATELPPKTENLIMVELGAEQRDLYESLRLMAKAEVLAQIDAGLPVFAALEALLRLRQAACHSALIPGSGLQTSAKLDHLMDLLSTELLPRGHAVLIISQWTSFLDQIGAALRAQDIDFARLDGSTRDRAGVIEHFQQGRTQILLLSLKAGGVGINLTAADHVFLMDPWWNPQVEAQAIDRAHRIGQDKPVFVHRLVAKDSVEEKILALKAAKLRLAEGALSGGEVGPSNMTQADLQELLS